MELKRKRKKINKFKLKQTKKMGLNYSLGKGDGVPGKQKKAKKAKQLTAEEVGNAGRAARLKVYDNAKDKKKMTEVVKINTQTAKAKAEGLKFNEYGAPLGEQQHKKFKLFKKEKPKFDRNSK